MDRCTKVSRRAGRSNSVVHLAGVERCAPAHMAQQPGTGCHCWHNTVGYWRTRGQCVSGRAAISTFVAWVGREARGRQRVRGEGVPSTLNTRLAKGDLHIPSPLHGSPAACFDACSEGSAATSGINIEFMRAGAERMR